MENQEKPPFNDLFQEERNEMVENQLFRRGIQDERVLEAMRYVPRHEFVPLEYQAFAYSDGPLPIGNGQTISQPFIVALMSELLELTGNEKILEVGTGSGYQTAILAELAEEIHSVERHAHLADAAGRCLQNLSYHNVHIHVGDGSMGFPEYSPFDGIIVTAAAPAVPQPLLDQLADGGRLVVPVGGRGDQILELWRRKGQDFQCEGILSVAFVPLIGEAGWKE
jgi:protein-L-isoaspartate(D-aspartate) O-methyltransferase